MFHAEQGALMATSEQQLAGSARHSVDRFFRKVEAVPWTGCWIWMGCRSSGYGHMRRGGVGVLAHRFAFELHKGAIPPELELDHLCREPSCVNPAHLEPVTTGENTRRGESARVTRARYAAITHCPRGHEYAGANVGFAISGKYTSRYCKTCRRSRRCAR